MLNRMVQVWSSVLQAAPRSDGAQKTFCVLAPFFPVLGLRKTVYLLFLPKMQLKCDQKDLKCGTIDACPLKYTTHIAHTTRHLRISYTALISQGGRFWAKKYFFGGLVQKSATGFDPFFAQKTL